MEDSRATLRLWFRTEWVAMPFTEVWELKESLGDKERFFVCSFICLFVFKCEIHFVHVKFEMSVRHPMGDMWRHLDTLVLISDFAVGICVSVVGGDIGVLGD